MQDVILASGAGRGCPVHPFSTTQWADRAATLDNPTRAAAKLARFEARFGELVIVPDGEGGVARVLFGLGERATLASGYRSLAGRLQAGDYEIVPMTDGSVSPPPDHIALHWCLGTYRFDRYKANPKADIPRLIAPVGADLARVEAIARACRLARDLVNTPANHLGPAELEAAVRGTAQANGAELSVIVGDDLLTAGYPAVHAVGRAATPARAPRMIEMSWGETGRPVVAIVGKGVVFDTGGLDLKPSAAMRLMKKDMGGAAHALALASMVIDLRLPVRLVLLIPAVENAVAGDAMRPGDVLASRQGLSIEVGNTDAEGRLILADALTRAAELSPDLTIDLATLTGAARAALGPEIPPFYTEDDALAGELANASREVEDPIWRMPLWEGYAPSLDSDVADIKNDPDAWAQAGSVTAALFLRRFAPKGVWAHFDIFAWNPRKRPGWPAGAEFQAIRAILAVLESRYR